MTPVDGLLMAIVNAIAWQVLKLSCHTSWVCRPKIWIITFKNYSFSILSGQFSLPMFFSNGGWVKSFCHVVTETKISTCCQRYTFLPSPQERFTKCLFYVLGNFLFALKFWPYKKREQKAFLAYILIQSMLPYFWKCFKMFLLDFR